MKKLSGLQILNASAKRKKEKDRALASSKKKPA